MKQDEMVKNGKVITVVLKSNDDKQEKQQKQFGMPFRFFSNIWFMCNQKLEQEERF